MKSPWDENALRRYLLGDLAVQEMDELEELYLADGDLFEQLTLVEDDLIEAYVRGELSSGDREKFNSRFLTSSRRKEKVENARAVREYLSRITVTEAGKKAEEKPRASLGQRLRTILLPSSPVPGLAIAIIILLVIGGAWMVYRLTQAQAQLKVLATARNELAERNTQLAEEIDQQTHKSSWLEQQVAEKQKENDMLAKQLAERPQGFFGSIASIFLVGLGEGSRGSGELKREIIPIKPETKIVRLTLILSKQQHNTYRAILEDSNNAQLGNPYSFPSITGKKAKIPFNVKASELMNGEHTILLTGRVDGGEEEVVRKYPVRIVRHP
jgi:hypothetical protein